MMNTVKQYIYDYFIPFLGKLCIKKNKFINVIYYHDIVRGEGYSYMRMNIDKFKAQMNYIAKKGYITVRFDDIQTEDGVAFSKKKVLIAFDDGWVSNYNEIFEFMKSINVKYNIFLTVNEIGNNPEYLTWEMVREMHNSGIVGFGSHTFHHVDASDISKIDTNIEFTKTDQIIEEQLGFKPTDFCYPYGYYSEASNEYLTRNTPYKHIYTSAQIYSYCQNDKIIMGRNGISDMDSFKVFKNKLDAYSNIYTLVFKYKHNLTK